MTSQSLRQRETLVLPAFYSTNHLLDRTPEPGETNRRPVRAVAVWAGAIDHEDRAGLIPGKIPLRDPPIRKVDRSRNVPAAYNDGLRTSSSTKPLSSRVLLASCTSQQSVSKVNRDEKWARASSLLAGGTAVTGLASTSGTRSC